jgi:hypothetical protein
MPFNLRGPELLVLLFLVAVVVGVVILIVWLVRVASRPSSRPQPTGPQPPGWYPVPDGTGRVAWWNGTHWDESALPPGF